MIKILIIDDEPIIREGLQRTINWEHLHCKIIGEAENGVEAIEKINTLVPDIVITDIMMPGLSGLELTKYVKDNYPHIKIIFLTGYNNFSFAQQAIKLGAFDFLLKPTNTEDLEKIIIKARDEIIKASEELQKQENMRKMMDASLPMLKDKFISDLLYSNITSVDEINRKMHFFGINIDAFIVLCMEIDNYNKAVEEVTEEDKFIYMFYIKEKINELLNRCRIQSIISCNLNTFSVILQFKKDESEELLKDSVISLAEELRNKIERMYDFTISIGISRFYQNISDIRIAYKEAIMCLENRFYIGNNSTIHIDDIFNFESAAGNREIDNKNIIEAIRTGNTQKIREEIDKVIEGLSHISNPVFVRNICIEIVASAARMYCAIYGNMEDILEDGVVPFDRLMKCTSAYDLFGIVRTIIAGIIDEILEKQNSQTRKVISKALEYININYHREITLNDLAGHVFMSPWYFSKLFKKETGETFSEFLLKTRIEKAKEILKSQLELKTYEVAEKVGFNDARYFGQIFKKVTGLTPSDFREMN